MPAVYIKKSKRLVNGRKRNIYNKKNSKKEYIKSKGRMVNLKKYLKSHKKKGGSKNIKQQIKEKANEIKKRIDMGLVSFYKKSPRGRRSYVSKSRSKSPPLPQPTKFF